MFNPLISDITAKNYIVGLRTDDGYLIHSSDKDPVSFFKLLLNLIIQETYKKTADGKYITPGVILKVLGKNIAHQNNFAKEPYDYESLLDAEVNKNYRKPNLLLGHRIQTEAAKLKRKLDEATSLGLDGNYLILLNADDQIFSLKDNEDRDLVLVYLYFMDSCEKYKLNPYKILRMLRQKAFSLRQKMLMRIQDDSPDGKPLLLFKIANGGRVDFCRDVDEFEREEKILSVLLKRETYHFQFCDFFVSTEKTVYMLISQQNSEDVLSYIRDVFHYFMIELSSEDNINTEDYIQKLLAAYKKCFEERKNYISDVFPNLESQDWINSEKVPVVKPTLPEPDKVDTDNIFNAINLLFENQELAGFFYMWHSKEDAGVNGAGSVSYQNSKLDDMSAVLFQFFGYTAIVYPSIRDALLNWHKTYKNSED